MDELPQQTPEGTAPYEKEEDVTHVSCDGITYEVLERPKPPHSHLEEKDLFRMAHFLAAKYPKGFTWEILPEIMGELVLFIGPNGEMLPKEKKKASVDVMHYYMVSLDPLYLPEKATDPFFEHLFPPFMQLALTFHHERALIKPSRQLPLPEDALLDYAETIAVQFEEGLTWKNLALAVRHSLGYMLSYQEIQKSTVVDGAYQIIETVLSQTDHFHLPADFDPPLFRLFLKAYLNKLLALEPIERNC